MGAVLMQRAAYGLANAVVRELRARGERLYGASVTVLAGKGNNGGDGLFAAAMLAGRGMRTTAVLTAGEAHPEGLAACEKAGGRVLRLTAENAGDAAAAAARADVVIDAVLGTGAQGGLRGTGRRADRGAGTLAARTRGGLRHSQRRGRRHRRGPRAGASRGSDRHVRGRQSRVAGRSRGGLHRPRAGRPDRDRVCPAPAGPAPLRSGRPVGAASATPGGAPTNTPAASWASWPARSGTPARRCWPAVARWRPGWAWCATWGRRTSPTWSASPAPKSCAEPAAPRRPMYRPGSSARAWTTKPTSNSSASATPQPPGCRSWLTPGRCLPCPATSPPGSC